MARVYVVHPTDNNISAASQYGPVCYITHRYVYGDEIDAANLMPIDFVQRLEKAAEEFNPEEDYFCLVGDHLQIVAFTAMLAARYDSFRVLRYDREAAGYLEVLIQS